MKLRRLPGRASWQGNALWILLWCTIWQTCTGFDKSPGVLQSPLPETPLKTRPTPQKRTWKISSEGVIEPNNDGGTVDGSSKDHAGLEQEVERLFQEKEDKKANYRTRRSPDTKQQLVLAQKQYSAAKARLDTLRNEKSIAPTQIADEEDVIEKEYHLLSREVQSHSTRTSKNFGRAARDEGNSDDPQIKIRKLEQEIARLKQSARATSSFSGAREEVDRSAVPEMMMSDELDLSERSAFQKTFADAFSSEFETRDKESNPLLVSLSSKESHATHPARTLGEDWPKTLYPLPPGFETSYQKQGHSLFFPSEAMSGPNPPIPNGGLHSKSLSLVRSGILPWNFSIHEHDSPKFDIEDVLRGVSPHNHSKPQQVPKSGKKRSLDSVVDLSAVNNIFSYGSQSQGQPSGIGGPGHKSKKSKSTSEQDSNRRGPSSAAAQRKVVGGEAGRVGQCLLEFALMKGLLNTKDKWKPREIIKLVKEDNDWEKHCERAGLKDQKLTDAMLGYMLSSFGFTRKSHNTGYVFNAESLAERLGVDIGSLQMKHILS